MDDIREPLRWLLLSDAAIAAAVTTGGTVRIYPGVLPQGTKLQSIVLNTITEAGDYHMQGSSGLEEARIQVDCWASQPGDEAALAKLVKDKLSGHAGIVAFGSESPQETINIQGIFHDQGRDDYDSVPKLYTRRRDYRIVYREV